MTKRSAFDSKEIESSQSLQAQARGVKGSMADRMGPEGYSSSVASSSGATVSGLAGGRLPPSAPASSLLPTIASAMTNPAQLLAQYSMLLQQQQQQQQIPPPGINSVNSAVAAANNNPFLAALTQMMAVQQQQAVTASSFAPLGLGASAPSTSIPLSVPKSLPPPPPQPPQTPVLAEATATASHVATTHNNGTTSNNTMQNWSAAQLAHQVSLLNHLNSPPVNVVPHSLSLMLSETQRNREKKEAKRVANRKSASVSRARKKALVQEMTVLNARLKRQALILALLPDLVIAINAEGVITFCSDQAQRLLLYKSDDLVGSKLYDLVVPSSRGRIVKLVKSLVGGGPQQEHKISSSSQSSSSSSGVLLSMDARHHRRHATDSLLHTSADAKPHKSKLIVDPHSINSCSNSCDESTPMTSDHTNKNSHHTGFPMSVVNVDSSMPVKKIPSSQLIALTTTSTPTTAAAATTKTPNADDDDMENDNENSSEDTSASGDSKQPSSLTNSVTMNRSAMIDSSGNSGSDDAEAAAPDSQKSKKNNKDNKDSHNNNNDQGSKDGLSCDTSSNTLSSLDAEAKKLSKANANLDRNVRLHNQKMKSKQQHQHCNPDEEEIVFKDDVRGAAVTANNASARLSSLRVVKDSSANRAADDLSSEEDDSGYRESNESREETSSSSASEMSESNKRRKPLSNTCNICLIRNDLTTLWCEVSSSVRTFLPEEEGDGTGAGGASIADGCVETRSASFSLPQPSQLPLLITSRASSITNETAEMTHAGISDKADLASLRPDAVRGGDVVVVGGTGKVVKEVLLCLRPIRDGDEVMDPKFRFVAAATTATTTAASTPRSREKMSTVSESSHTTQTSEPKHSGQQRVDSSGIVEVVHKRRRLDSDPGMDAAVAESLMLMSSSKKV